MEAIPYSRLEPHMLAYLGKKQFLEGIMLAWKSRVWVEGCQSTFVGWLIPRLRLFRSSAEAFCSCRLRGVLL